MTEGNGTLEMPPYIECEGCKGRGIVKARVDAEYRVPGRKDPAQVTVFREHDRCNGAGILILRIPVTKKASPYYGAPKLS